MPKHQQSYNTILDDFPISSKKEWEELAKSTMSDSDFEKFMNGKPGDGVIIRPYYSQEDFKENTLEKTPFSVMLSPNAWQFQEIVFLNESSSLEKANQQILRALEGGVDSILIDFSAYQPDIDLDTLLKGVMREAIDISLLLSSSSSMPKGYSLSGMQGTLYLNPLESYMLKGEDYHSGFAKLESLLRSNPAGYRCLAVSGEIFANCGATIIEEVALSCNLLLEYLDHFTDKGMNAGELFQNLEITLSTRTAYLADIAKFRAMNILLEKIMASYSVPLEIAIPLRAVSAIYNKADYDLNTNLLRNTTEAMAAILGNCQKICLTPHNGNRFIDNEFGRRMARNVSHLLRHESHLDLVQDPLKGSYALESLTSSIAEKAWSLFCQIETEGGLLSAFESGKLQQMLSESAANYLQKLRSLRKTAVGANRYVPANQVSQVHEAHFVVAKPKPNNTPCLTEIRGPAVIESIRKMVDHEVSHGKHRPLVGVIPLSERSRPAIVSVRTAFVEDIMTSIGLNSTRLEGNFFSAQISQNELSVLVVVGDDGEYLALQADEFNARAQHYKLPLVIAGYPKNIAESMSSYGLLSFIYAKMNVPAFADELFNRINLFDV